MASKYLRKKRFGGIRLREPFGRVFSDKSPDMSGKERFVEDFVLEHLKPHIDSTFFYREDAPTIVKRRFVGPVFQDVRGQFSRRQASL